MNFDPCPPNSTRPEPQPPAWRASFRLTSHVLATIASHSIPMKRILVSIILSPEGMATIRADQGLQRAEMAFIEKWKAEGILENFYITTDRTGAFLIFNGVDGDRTKELIGGLPYFPYMSRVDYVELDKQF